MYYIPELVFIRGTRFKVEGMCMCIFNISIKINNKRNFTYMNEHLEIANDRENFYEHLPTHIK